MTLIWSIGKQPEGDIWRPGNEKGQKGGRGQGSGTQGSRVGREWRMAEGGIRGRKSSNIGEFAFPPSCHQFFHYKVPHCWGTWDRARSRAEGLWGEMLRKEERKGILPRADRAALAAHPKVAPTKVAPKGAVASWVCGFALSPSIF